MSSDFLPLLLFTLVACGPHPRPPASNGKSLAAERNLQIPSGHSFSNMEVRCDHELWGGALYAAALPERCGEHYLITTQTQLLGISAIVRPATGEFQLLGLGSLMHDGITEPPDTVVFNLYTQGLTVDFNAPGLQDHFEFTSTLDHSFGAAILWEQCTVRVDDACQPEVNTRKAQLDCVNWPKEPGPTWYLGPPWPPPQKTDAPIPP